MEKSDNHSGSTGNLKVSRQTRFNEIKFQNFVQWASHRRCRHSAWTNTHAGGLEIFQDFWMSFKTSGIERTHFEWNVIIRIFVWPNFGHKTFLQVQTKREQTYVRVKCMKDHQAIADHVEDGEEQPKSEQDAASVYVLLFLVQR